MSTTPLVAATLCTFNRAPLLRRALASLCDQTLPPDAFEVVVVDDGSTDSTREVVRAFEHRLPLRYSHQANAGLASGKNHALALARAPLVVFCDDDDILAPDTLEAHVRAHREHPDPRVAVLGYTDLFPEVARSPLMHFVTEVGCHLFYYPHLTHAAHLDFSFFWGGRSSCKRELLMEYGVFNPVFRFGCEDIELAYRLSKTGFRVVYDKRVRTSMIRTLDFEGFCRRCYLQGRSNFVFASLHPVEQVHAWAELARLEDEWADIEPRFDDIMKAGRDLDRLANDRMASGAPLDELTQVLLHRAYYAAFKANRIKGSIESKREALASAA
jgi:glycosyltransferase involved in cell wall biosynthesis